MKEISKETKDGSPTKTEERKQMERNKKKGKKGTATKDRRNGKAEVKNPPARFFCPGNHRAAPDDVVLAVVAVEIAGGARRRHRRPEAAAGKNGGGELAQSPPGRRSGRPRRQNLGRQGSFARRHRPTMLQECGE